MKNRDRLLFAVPLLFVVLGNLTSAFAQITPSQDSYTNTATGTTNYGSATTLGVVSSGTSIQTTYIKFDLSSVPTGYTSANVAKATLKLYVNSVAKGGSFNVDYVNGNWTEKIITADLAPALGNTIASSVHLTTASVNNYIEIDVTSAVGEWLNGSQANDGIALVPNSGLSGTFDSKENTAQSQPAQLDVVFTSGGTISGVTTASGSGLTGGGNSGDLSLSLTKSCSSNQVLQWNGSAWVCTSAGTGTIGGVTAGTDLTGGGKSGNVILNLDTTKVPQLNANNFFTGNQSIGGSLSASSNTGNAIYGENNLDADFQAAIAGDELGATKATFGVLGYVQSSSGVGVFGQSVEASGTGSVGTLATGVWGDTGQPGGTGVYGTTDDGQAFLGGNNSTTQATMWLVNHETTDAHAPVLHAHNLSFGGDCIIDVSGDLACSGSKSAVVPVDNASRKVALYAVESPENWFEDFGSGTLAAGEATVALEPTFAQTVNVATEYHVFLTPKGDCKGLYVANETPAGFEVHELGGGQSHVAFDYRIVARRKGYESIRLADKTKQFTARMQMPNPQQLVGPRTSHRPSAKRAISAHSAVPQNNTQVAGRYARQ